ncbi:MAG: response regulator [Dehalococcoidia bacterium]
MARGRVQVVISEVIVADDVHTTLQEFGYRVTAVVDSGQEAVERAEDDVPDLVLIDTDLTGHMDGFETAEKICSRSNVPIVYLTPRVDRQFTERAKRTVPYSFVLKPFAEDELESAMQMAVR